MTSTDNLKNISVLWDWVLNDLKPEPRLTVSQWADRFRVLSKKASSEPGPWDTSRTPYLREIMDVLSVNNPAKKIVFKKSSQVGGTECGNNWVGYIIDHAPAPMMIVQPTVDTAKRNSRLRIQPLIDESPRIRQKVSEIKSKDSSNTVQQKDFPGGTLVMTGANSAAGLRSMPARFIMLDEVDAYPRDVEGEGDPISLVLARSRTFSRRKAFLVSTPTTDGLSKIDEEFRNSDQRFFFVPCPHCQHKQKLVFDNLQWTAGKPETVLYYCEECGTGIEERFKTKMLNEGEWRAQAKSETIGFHINSLYSPLGWFSWRDIAREYEDAKTEQEKEKKTTKMKTFVNTILGETYRELGDAPEWKRLYLQREGYKIGVVPNKVYFLTAGADVQKDRIEIEIVGWGRNKESWSVDYQIFRGDTSDEKVWNEFKDFLNSKTFPKQSGGELPIRMTAIDSGYNTQHVYNFVRQFAPTKVAAVKGNESLQMIVGIPKVVDARSAKGKVFRRAVKLWSVGVSVVKTELYGWLKYDPPIGTEEFPTGFCHFPEYDEEFFKQLTSEKIVVKHNRKGFTTMDFVKDRERNEALDCRVYARAAASMVGLDRMRDKDFDKLVNQPVAKTEKINNDKQDEATQQNAPALKPQRSKRERSSFWD